MIHGMTAIGWMSGCRQEGGGGVGGGRMMRRRRSGFGGQGEVKDRNEKQARCGMLEKECTPNMGG